jgi:hypothetical protein
MIESAAEKTMGPAKELADKLCQKYDSSSAMSESDKIYVEWGFTLLAASLMELVGEKRAHVSLAHPYVVVIFADSREEAHQIVLDELANV